LIQITQIYRLTLSHNNAQTIQTIQISRIHR